MLNYFKINRANNTTENYSNKKIKLNIQYFKKIEDQHDNHPKIHIFKEDNTK